VNKGDQEGFEDNTIWENNVPSPKMKANKKITQRTKKNGIFQPSFGKMLLTYFSSQK